MTNIDQSDIYEEATNTSKDGLSRCFDKNTGSELHIALSGLFCTLWTLDELPDNPLRKIQLLKIFGIFAPTFKSPRAHMVRVYSLEVDNSFPSFLNHF